MYLNPTWTLSVHTQFIFLVGGFCLCLDHLGHVSSGVTNFNMLHLLSLHKLGAGLSPLRGRFPCDTMFTDFESGENRWWATVFRG